MAGGGVSVDQGRVRPGHGGPAGGALLHGGLRPRHPGDLTTLTSPHLTRPNPPSAACAAPGRGRVPVPGGRGGGRGARPVRPRQRHRQLRARAALHSAGRPPYQTCRRCLTVFL